MTNSPPTHTQINKHSRHTPCGRPSKILRSSSDIDPSLHAVEAWIISFSHNYIQCMHNTMQYKYTINNIPTYMHNSPQYKYKQHT